MLVDRPQSDIATARKRHLRLLILAKKRTQQIVGCPDLLDIIVFDHQIADLGSIDLNRMSVHSLDNDADTLHRLHQHIGIPDIRYVLYHNGLIRHNSRSKNSQSRILGTTDLHLAD